MDRFEGALRLVMLLGFLVAAPLVAPAAGHFAHVAGLRQVRQEAGWREVSAVLIDPAPRYYGYGSMTTHWVAGRWRTPTGAIRTGMVSARTGSPAGTKVSIWVDQQGQLTGRHPTTVTMVRFRTVLAELGSVAGLAGVLIAFGFMVRLLLNRRRMTYWGIEWACFGPRWSARRRPPRGW